MNKEKWGKCPSETGKGLMQSQYTITGSYCKNKLFWLYRCSLEAKKCIDTVSRALLMTSDEKLGICVNLVKSEIAFMNMRLKASVND